MFGSKTSILTFIITLSSFLSLASSASASPRIFVLFGGFGSCALAGDPSSMNMTEYFQSTVKNATQHDSEEPLVYQACYAIGNGTLFYMRPDGETIRGDRASFVAELSKIATLRSLNLIGQSHGGWTALVVSLEVPANTVDTVVSIDAISVAECSSSEWLASTTIAAIGLGASEGCTSYPSDLLAYSKSIRSRVNYWINFWQDEFSLLHSGPVSGANENTQLSFDAWSWHAMGAHAEMEYSPILWNRVERLWNK